MIPIAPRDRSTTIRLQGRQSKRRMTQAATTEFATTEFPTTEQNQTAAI
jgi:hypothetical protein